jgi:hypothetical protein
MFIRCDNLLTGRRFGNIAIKKKWRGQSDWVSSSRQRVYSVTNWTPVRLLCLALFLQFLFAIPHKTSFHFLFSTWPVRHVCEGAPRNKKQFHILDAQHCRMSTWIFSVCPLARGNGIRRKMASWIWRECDVLAKERKRIWVELRE